METLRIDYNTAKDLYQSRCPYHLEFPYTILCDRSDMFSLVEIPICDIQISEIHWYNRSEKSKAKLLRLQSVPEPDPIWVYFDGKIKIADGYHRTITTIRRGIPNIKAFFPETQYAAYRASKL